MKSNIAKCLYRKGLETPFVNLEDIFITGLAREKCKDEGVVLRNSPRFHYMGRHLCLVKKYDILVNGIYPDNPDYYSTNTTISISVQNFIFKTKRFSEFCYPTLTPPPTQLWLPFM